MENGDSVFSPDGTLKVTLIGFDPAGGAGQLEIEELISEPSSYSVIAIFAGGSQHRIDYKTFDVYKSALHQVETRSRYDRIIDIQIVRVPAS